MEDITSANLIKYLLFNRAVINCDPTSLCVAAGQVLDVYLFARRHSAPPYNTVLMLPLRARADGINVGYKAGLSRDSGILAHTQSERMVMNETCQSYC